ncbi:uncharacterized protein LOC111695405 [Eurytemora carolleeae]|uniref:uncharacterized protein LOC111695405 n=1 Tax=Eurytemora carolleeae TaxID=1294199 RepID=UPI000C75C51F|nr:uncharacterized protein LOC111695405 [Eurytemora carolleeae]|eukprot:XP_023320494.1 uncharacterized protein LOC111695405 [Eurytemora affinis]
MLKGVFICFLMIQLVFLTEGKIKEMKQGSCTETCLQDIYDSVTFNRDKVGNFLRQKARLENFLKVQSKKLDKKDDYAVFADELAAGLGGNSTSFICGVKNQGTQLNNATETYKFLQSCSSSIVASCTKDTTMISPEIEAELAACETKMLEFQAKVEGKYG